MQESDEAASDNGRATSRFPTRRSGTESLLSLELIMTSRESESGSRDEGGSSGDNSTVTLSLTSFVEEELGSGDSRVVTAVELPFSMSVVEGQHLFYVVPGLPVDCLCGLDLLRRHRLLVDPAASRVFVDTSAVSIPAPNSAAASDLSCSLSNSGKLCPNRIKTGI